MYNLEGRLSYRITDIYDITVTRDCIGQLQFYRLSHSENLPSGSLKAHLDAELLFHHRRSFWWRPFAGYKYCTKVQLLKYNNVGVYLTPCTKTFLFQPWIPRRVASEGGAVGTALYTWSLGRRRVAPRTTSR